MKASLSVKTIIMTVVFALALGVVEIVVSSNIINKVIEKQHMNKGNEIAASLAVVVDPDECKVLKESIEKIYNSIPKDERVGSEDWGSDAFNEYVAKYDSVKDLPEYDTTMNKLREMQGVNDVDCLYLIYTCIEDEKFVYMVDADLEDPCPPGNFDPLNIINADIMTIPERGFPAYITNTEEYGHLVTAGAPVFDENNNVICYAMVDVWMNEIRAKQKQFITIMIVILGIVTVIMGLIGAIAMRICIVKPINKLAKAAKEYCADNSMEMRNTFAALDIHTHDEIEDLAEAMKHMETDINDYIADFIVTNEMLNSALEQNNDNE